MECSPTGPRVAEENAPCHAGGLVPDHADRAIGFCQSTRGRAAEAKAGHAEAVPTHTYGTVLSVHAHHMIHGGPVPAPRLTRMSEVPFTVASRKAQWQSGSAIRILGPAAC